MTPALLLLAASVTAPPEPVRDLKLPPNFSARLYADNPLAPDIYTMTIDDDGRVLVAGRGYVRVLVDDDGDGYADRAIELIDDLKDGPMGLLAEGDSLFVVSDGGLKRYRGYNGKDKLKGPPETLLAVKTAGEHDAHAVRRGPDGWLYLLCGNSTGVKKETLKGDRSPVKDPIAGVLVRLSPDFKAVEVVADGFRNPYSFDFNLDGEPFTYDSDNERCVGLPWHEGSRFYHIVPGGNYGWRSPQLSQTWRKPPYFPDVVPPLCDTGRGSPTGVACYRHTHFPKVYWGGFFLADWTFGRIYHVPLKAKGSSYTGKHEIFAEATGTSGFAPTAIAVHPKTGELFVGIGGRGTRGAVYRISYDKADANPQPLAMARRSLDFEKALDKQWLTDCDSSDPRARRHALEMMLRWWDKVDRGPRLSDAVRPNMSNADPLIRRACGRLAVLWPTQLAGVSSPQARLTVALAEAEKEPDDSLKTALKILLSKDSTEEMKLEAVRTVQLVFGDFTSKEAMGTVFEGYTFRKPPKKEVADKVLESLIPLMMRHNDALRDKPITNLERELARLAACFGGPEDARHTLVSVWLGDLRFRAYRHGDMRDDIHLLACWGRLSHFAWRDEDGAISRTLLELETRRAERKIGADRHWGMRIDELAAALFPGHNNHLAETMLRDKQFGRLEHLRFVRYLQDRSTNTTPVGVSRRLLPAAERDPDSPFARLIFEFLPQLPRNEIAKLLDVFWERPHLQDSVVRVLASKPQEGDQPRLIVGLQSLDPDVVRLSAKSLATLKKPDGSAVLIAGIKALRRLPGEKPNAEARAELVSLLQKLTGEKITADAKPWAEWLAKHDPEAAKKLDAADGFNPVAWQKRASGIDWAKGNAERGRLVFTKATCAACHDRAGAIGPSLLGISKRFSRDDLLTAILQPGKDVSARYRPTRVVTTDDKAYTGILIYDAPDSVILQTNADTLVRLAGSEIASKKQVDVSLMPAGLVDKLSDAEIADLLAYLGTLETK